MTNILCIADLHLPSKSDIQKICSLPSPDMIFYLGDIYETHLKLIYQSYPKAFHVGVLGNHDTYRLETYGIMNLDKQYIEKSGISIVGLEGSILYKDTSYHYPSYTQGESLIYCNILPKADVLLSHTSPYGIHDDESSSHQGLIGLREYIDKHCPRYNIHGHQHVDRKTVLESGTIVIGIYGASILEFETGEITKII